MCRNSSCDKCLILEHYALAKNLAFSFLDACLRIKGHCTNVAYIQDKTKLGGQFV